MLPMEKLCKSLHAIYCILYLTNSIHMFSTIEKDFFVLENWVSNRY